jgi:hypothetical protein
LLEIDLYIFKDSNEGVGIGIVIIIIGIALHVKNVTMLIVSMPCDDN